MHFKTSGSLLFAMLMLTWISQWTATTMAQSPSEYRGAAEPTTSPEIYGQGVRETQWRTPAIEQSGFHLPPGFEIELFASEPQVSKPLNMAWDARGRLWVTCTVEYPYPAKEGTVPRDTIRILEDTDKDGRADKVTTFADELNIPMGLLPVEDGVICFSIPYIWHLKDTDGDDCVDERIKLLGPFDTTRDTHGMINSLSRGSDGWIYACHGFNNQSSVTATDGSSVTMISGNTFRFKPDGSSIEHFTFGQVNPFGLTRDEWGNWYSADCHSKPLTALLPGACYPSFGRPHDGLGFAPDMMQHLHGSTAICGLVYYQASDFPPAYRHLFYSGNVMTSRINCNVGQWSGATVAAVEQPDFLTSDDPWFRPVDIQLGQDGALYVADFYNKIIGHYEVPLTHPDRDRESGRIWRIVYRGTGGKESPTEPALKSNSLRELGMRLSSENLTVRRAAIEQMVVESEPSNEAWASMLSAGDQGTSLRQSALEILHRRGALNGEILKSLIQTAPTELRVLALWLVGEQSAQTRKTLLPDLRQCLASTEHSQVRKVAIRCVGMTGDATDVEGLLRISRDEREADPVLSQAAKIAARQLLRDRSILLEVAAAWIGMAATANSIAIDGEFANLLTEILPAVDSIDSARALLGFLSARGDAIDNEQLERAIAFASKYADDDIAPPLLHAIEQVTQGDLIRRATLLTQLIDAGQAKRRGLNAPVLAFGTDLQSRLFTELQQRLAQSGRSVEWTDGSGSAWGVEDRKCADGLPVSLTSSLTRSERYVGVLNSEVIECPAELSFWLAGHNGPPQEDDHQSNRVRLVHVGTGQTLAEALPPRNDVARRVAWSLADFAGQPVRVEVIDGDSGSAYAWLAVGRFSTPRLERGNVEELLTAIGALLQRGVEPLEFSQQFEGLPLSQGQLAKLISAALLGRGSQPSATLAAQAIALGRSDIVQPELLIPGTEQVERRGKIAAELCATATASQQTEFAKSLLATPSGCELLRDLLERGGLSMRALIGIQPLLPGGLSAEVRGFLEKQLTAAASLPSAEVDVAGRVAKLAWDVATLEGGHEVYKQHCAACHQFGKEGTLIGPQLDGVKLRGAARLSEDILDPNRNVDRAFRLTALRLDDDSVLSGLVRAEADGSLTVVGQDGKSKKVAAATVSESRESDQSLMPSNFGEVLNDQQLASLLRFLAETP